MSWVTKTTARRLSAIRLPEHLLHQHARLGVQRAERFVHQQYVRVGSEGARNRNALLHPAGQLLGVRALKAVELHFLDPGAHYRVALSAVEHTMAQAERDVGAHRQPREQRVFLEHHSTVGARLVYQTPIDQHLPRIGANEPGDRAQHGGLAAP